MTRTRALMIVAGAALASLLVAGCSAGSSGGTSSKAPAAPAHGPAQPYQANPNQDGAPGSAAEAPIDNSGEVSAAERPSSTFAVDVDTASYGYARRVLTDGRRPEPSTVRPEEFINAFRQDYPQPGGNGFTVNMDGARAPGDRGGDEGQLRLMRVGLQTKAENAAQRTDAVLTFVVDVSGSMGEPGKLDLVRDALDTLIDQLRPTDAVAIVAYDDRAKVLRPMTDVRNRSALHSAIDRLSPGGSTNLEAGLVTGYQVAREGFREGATNRVILLSDGLANVGDTSAGPILSRVREAAAKQISLLGVGVGSDYGDALMEQLADNGDGFVVYVSELAQAKRVFVEQLPATLALRALDAKVQVTFDPGAVESYRLIGYDNRALPSSSFRNDHVDGGEVGPGHAVTALYAVRLRSGGYSQSRARVAETRVRWQDPVTKEPAEQGATMTVADLDGGFETANPRLRQTYVCAYFAEVLRGSRYGSETSLPELTRIADGVASATEDRDVTELSALLRKASRVLG
jgi:Ca-activated chloride channel family protein